MHDAELAALAQAGDRDAFGELVRRYAPKARRVARAGLGNTDDADDAAQDGFLLALRRRVRYAPGRPFGPWLVRIVANAATDRRRRRRVRAVEAIPPTVPAAGPAPGRETDRPALHAALEDALGTPPGRQPGAAGLFDVGG